MFATFIVQIFARYVLNNPVGWSEEVIITTWLWTVLVGRGLHPPRSRRKSASTSSTRQSRSGRGASSRCITGVALVVLYGISLPAAYKLRQLHEGRALGLSAHADQLAVFASSSSSASPASAAIAG